MAGAVRLLSCLSGGGARRTAAAFWRKVLVDVVSGCWLWQGSKDANGYGQQRVDYRLRQATHVSWWLVHGVDPRPAFVLHACDNPECVNPAHLFLGTQTTNMQDCARKKRTMRHDRHNHAKLTTDTVRWMRWSREYAGVSYCALAKSFGVTRETARQAVVGRTWAP